MIPADDPHPRHSSGGVPHFVVAICLPLLVALAVAKAFACGTWSWDSWRFPIKWSILAYQDVLFVVGWAAVGTVICVVNRKWIRSRTISAAYVAASVLIVLYGVVSVAAYSALRMPLTYPLLKMAGTLAEVRSSVQTYVTPQFVIALILAPVLYLAAVYLLWRWRRIGRLCVRRNGIILVIVASTYVLGAAHAFRHYFAGGPEAALGRNPHWTLIESFLAGDSGFQLHDSGPASFVDDFLPVGDRHDAIAPVARNSPIKNVIIVVLESTSTQFLNVYGGEYATTPCLVAEAKNCLIFPNVYSNAGYSIPAAMPLLLSIYPGTGWKLYPVAYPQLRGTSAAQVLRERGYRTAFMTGGLLQFQNMSRFYANRGLDVIEGAEEFCKSGQGAMVSSWGMDDPPLFDAMLNWIDQEPGRPFYMLAWTQQTHHPYTLGPHQVAIDMVNGASNERQRMLNLYLNDLHDVDAQLGRLFAHLRDRRIADQTLVVITGDHGEAFGFPHPWFFHGTALYQESVNVPCIFWNPKLFHPGKRSDAVGAHVDLNPTIFDLLGLPLPAAWQGRSLLDPWRPNRAYFSCNTGSLLQGLREGTYKYIYNATLGREELYELAGDPTEQVNLAKLQPDRCAVFRQHLAAWASFDRKHLADLTGK
jgi:arylsulfatase A-like enzyme